MSKYDSICTDKSDIKKMATDAMFKLEHGSDDKAKLKTKLPGLVEIEGAQSRWRDDYELNLQARKMFRVRHHCPIYYFFALTQLY